jgi:septal ring factor EnvC (AmiA/AmiB activator)
MSNEEKILEIVTQMQGDFKQMQGDFKKFDKRLSNVEKGQAELAKDVKIIKADVSYLKSASNEAFKDIDILDRRTEPLTKMAYRGI